MWHWYYWLGITDNRHYMTQNINSRNINWGSTITLWSSLFWGVKSCSAGRKISQHFRGPKGSLLCSQKPTTGPVLSQINSVHYLPSYICMIQFNTILSAKPKSSKCSLYFRFSYQNFVYISLLSHASFMPQPSRTLWLTILIIFGKEYKLWSPSLCNTTAICNTNSVSPRSLLTYSQNFICVTSAVEERTTSPSQAGF
jgi:hypothetical protein